MADHFIEHEPCPSCRKKGRDRTGNNLGVYADGHKYCFSCSYRVSAPIHTIIESKTEARRIAAENSSDTASGEVPPVLRLPADSRPILEVDTGKWEHWINDNGALTYGELTNNLVMYSENGWTLLKKKVQLAPLIIFPVFDPYNNLLLWNGRNLSYPETSPKWVIKGKPEKVVHCIMPEKCTDNDTAVLCEDQISAIKIGRIKHAYPLFGKNVSPVLLNYLQQHYNNIVIWLDFDAYSDSMKLQSRLQPLFKEVRIVVSQHDPKLYDTEALRGYLK